MPEKKGRLGVGHLKNSGTGVPACRQTLKLLRKLLVVTNDPVEVLVLSHPTKSLMLALHLMGCEGLPGMKKCLGVIRRKRRYQSVDMIVHYHISK